MLDVLCPLVNYILIFEMAMTDAWGRLQTGGSVGLATATFPPHLAEETESCFSSDVSLLDLCTTHIKLVAESIRLTPI